MKWILGLVGLVFALWLSLNVSPLIAMASMGAALQRHDQSAVIQRLDMAAIRVSLTSQLVNAYWDATGRRPPPSLTPFAGAGAAALLNPLVSDYVTESSIMSFLDKGVPTNADHDEGMGRSGIARVWTLWLESEQRGFSKVLFKLPPGKPRREQYGLVLRLTGWRWKVAAVELPVGLRETIVREIVSKHGQLG
jgi:hypothetical protein